MERTAAAHNGKKRIIPYTVVLCLLVLGTVGLSWVRLYFGAEMTDEALYVADAHLVAQGAVPYVSLLMQTAGSTVFYAWLIPVYRFFTGGLEGIFLFLRQAYFVFKLLVLGGVFFTLKKHIRPHWLVLFLLPFVPYSPHNIDQFCYNSLPPLFILLGAALAFAAARAETKKAAWLLAGGSGVCLAMATFSNPAQGITALVLGGCLLAAQLYKKQLPTRFFAYCAGGVLFAAAVTVYMLLAGGGLAKLVEGIRLTLGGNYFSIQVYDSFWGRVAPLFEQWRYFAMCIGIFVVVWGVGCVVLAVKNRKADQISKQSLKKLCLLCLLCSLVLFLVWACCVAWRGGYPLAWYTAALVLTFAVFSLLPFITARRPLARSLLWYIFLPLFCYEVIACVFNLYGAGSRAFLFFPTAAFATLFACFALADTFGKAPAGEGQQVQRRPGWQRWAALGFAAVMTLTSGFSSYRIVYRDEGIPALTAKVERGPYRGLYTTPARRELLYALEEEIAALAGPGDTVLFLDYVPFAYLLTDARSCAPTAADVLAYSMGQTDPAQMLGYFAQTGGAPDKIIYLYVDGKPPLSITAEDYPFSMYVQEHYTLAYTNENEQFSVVVYEKNN